MMKVTTAILASSFTMPKQHTTKPIDGKPSREARWPAVLAIIGIVGLILTLPERLTAGPFWLIPVTALLLMGVTMWAFQRGNHHLNYLVGVVLLSLITGSQIWSLTALVLGLPGRHQPPTELLRSAAALWMSNVLVFASWYWRLDAGGPHARHMRDQHTEGSFLFPQMTLPSDSPLVTPNWKPGFVDYVFLAFNTSTAFSPTDVPVLGHWAKLLVMVQSLISLCTVAILLARAIGML